MANSNDFSRKLEHIYKGESSYLLPMQSTNATKSSALSDYDIKVDRTDESFMGDEPHSSIQKQVSELQYYKNLLENVRRVI